MQYSEDLSTRDLCPYLSFNPGELPLLSPGRCFNARSRPQKTPPKRPQGLSGRIAFKSDINFEPLGETEPD